MSQTFLDYKLIQLVREYIHPTGAKFIVDETLFLQASAHSLLTLLYTYMDKENTEGAIRDKGRKYFLSLVAKDKAQNEFYDEFINNLEKEEVDTLPIKGPILKKLYKESYLRYSGDLDFLFSEASFPKMEGVMKDMGLVKGVKGEVHDAYWKYPFVEVEAHHRLFSETKGNRIALFEKPFEYAKPIEGYKHIYAYSDEDFLIYMMSHLLKHLENGGSGLRSFLDFYLYLYKHPKLNLDYVAEELGLNKSKYSFEFLMRFTIDLFEADKLDEKENSLLELVLLSGVYGTEAIAYRQGLEAHKGNRAAYFFSRLLPSPKVLGAGYPIVKKCPLLYPFVLVHRINKALFLHPGRTARNLKRFGHKKEKEE